MWRCPVCEQDVPRRPGEVLPGRHVVYRCPFCKIDLVFDEDYARFKLAPLNANEKKKKKKRRR